MNIFLKNIVAFAFLISILWFVVEGLIPQVPLTFRNWEIFQVLDYSKFAGPWMPNQTVIRDELGDMGHHTDREIVKENIRWTTDDLGYRNDVFIKDPDIVFIGASNILGSGMDQEDFLGPVMGRMLDRITYTMAPTHFNELARHIHNKVIDKPDMVIYGCLERLIPEFKALNKKWIKSNIKNKDKYHNNWYKFYNKLHQRLKKKMFKNFVKARINGSTGWGEPSPVDDKMMIFKKNNDLVKASRDEIKKHAKIISDYHNYLKRKGIKFIFFPIPNKGTIYYETVPLDKQPDYLKKLFVELKKKKVPHINTLDLFNNHKTKELIYHYDDSHWNENAVNLVAKKLSKKINQLERKSEN